MAHNEPPPLFDDDENDEEFHVPNKINDVTHTSTVPGVASHNNTVNEDSPDTKLNACVPVRNFHTSGQALLGRDGENLPQSEHVSLTADMEHEPLRILQMDSDDDLPVRPIIPAGSRTTPSQAKHNGEYKHGPDELNVNNTNDDNDLDFNNSTSPAVTIEPAGSGLNKKVGSVKTGDGHSSNVTSRMFASPTDSVSLAAPFAPPGFSVMGSNRLSRAQSEIEESKYSIEIKIPDYRKVGDGMSAYMTFRVSTKTTIPDFRRQEVEVYRRFSDFLGLHEKLVAKHVHQGRVVPPPPEKSVIGMTKIKISKDEASSASSNTSEFLFKRRASLERFLNRIAQHPALQIDPNFVDFLEMDGELPKSSNTSALSSAGIMRLFNRVGDSIGKMAYKIDETDQWFEEKTQAIENLDEELKQLHSSIESLVNNRKELADTTGMFAKSVGVLGNAEEHTSLSRALSQLAELEEKVDLVHDEQATNDYFIFEELINDYIIMVQAVKDVFNERAKMHKAMKDDEVTLSKKRETKARMELAHKMDKISEATHEITEWEHRVDKSREDFENISKNIRKELARFERQRCKDFRTAIIAYLESLLSTQQQILRHWETFLPEARLIV